MGPSGFCIIFTAGLASAYFLYAKDSNTSWQLDARQVLTGQIWRLITSHLGFSTKGAFVLGIGLLYYFRQFERMMGSRKFGSFVTLSLTFSSVLQFAIVVIAQRLSFFPTGIIPASGPYCLIFSLFALFQAYIPKIHRYFGLLGMNFSDKSTFYFIGAMLMFSEGYRSFVPSLCGLLAGGLYISPTFQFDSFRLPRWFTRPFEILEPIFRSTPPNTRPGNVGGGRRPQQPLNNNNNGGWAQGGLDQHSLDQLALLQQMLAAAHGPNGPNNFPMGPTTAAPAPAPRPPAPFVLDEEKALNLMEAFGVDHDTAAEALRRTDNNVELAANHILNGL